MSNDQLEREHHPSLYLEDGDIILLAPKSDGITQVFRVDQVFLSRSSSVFKTMFTLPCVGSGGGLNVNEMYEGVPVVHLSDDAFDLGSLLNFVYHRLPSPKDSPNPATYRVYRGILSLTTKYVMDELKALIFQQIEAHWPTTYVAWCREWAADAEEERTVYKKPDQEQILQNAAYVIRLAREFDIPSVLPAAFYQLATAHQHLSSDAAITFRTILNQDDLICLLQVKDHLGELMSDIAFTLEGGKCASEPPDAVCQRELSRTSSDFFGNETPTLDVRHIVGRYQRMVPPRVCGKCYPSLDGDFKRFRINTWNFLPGWIEGCYKSIAV